MLKKLIIPLIFAFSFLFTTVNAQSEQISPEKKKIISEIMTVTKADIKAKEVMNSMFVQMRKSAPMIAEATLAEQKNLTQEEKQKIKKSLLEQNNFAKNFEEKFIKAINFQNYIEQVFYPLYDKFFSEQELRELLAFYKSPVGQKFNDISPQFMAESMKQSQSFLMPKILEIFNEIISEQANVSVVKPSKSGRKSNK